MGYGIGSVPSGVGGGYFLLIYGISSQFIEHLLTIILVQKSAITGESLC